MAKRKRTFNVKSYAIAVLRRASYRTPARGEVLRTARVAYGRYRCAKCTDVFGRKEVQVDHILPVVQTSGWDGFDGFISRLFCDPSGLQVLCKPCHKDKSQAENKTRKRAK
jgi:5-methylcytosine-specific restriction endonuclease McrA